MVRLQSGHFFLPKSKDTEFRQFNKLHKFTSDPLVSEWMDDLLTRRQGLPLKVWKTRLRLVETVCNTYKVTPYDLTISKKKTEKIMRTFAKQRHYLLKYWQKLIRDEHNCICKSSGGS